MTSPICPGGTQPKPGVEGFVMVAGSIVEYLLGAKYKWLAPFLAVTAPIALDTNILCNGDPPAMPNWAEEDLVAVYQGNVLAKVKQTIEHLAWYEWCQCSGSATPTPPTVPPPAGLPQLPSGPVEACDQVHAEYSHNPQLPSVNRPIYPATGPPVFLVQGATAVSINAQITQIGTNPASTNTNVFRVSFWNAAASATTTGFTITLDPLVNGGAVSLPNQPLPAGTARISITHDCQPGGTCQEGRVAIIDLAFHCGSEPGRLQPECCPPDPAIVGKLDRLLLQMALVVARLGPTDPLQTISTSPISGEGQMALAQGARMVRFALTTLGADVQTVPYANPDRLRRAATMRFGNDFGWQRRQSLDAAENVFAVPLDSQVVSWSLSPGTSGSLVQLGVLT